MREIKLRYILEKDGEIKIYHTTIDRLERSNELFNLSLQGWSIKNRNLGTSLLDKNSVEIYEGDILNWVFDKRNSPFYYDYLDAPPHHLVKNISEIRFIDGVFCVWTDGGDFVAPLKGNIDRSQMGEIIGNIYENKELLEKKCTKN